MNLVYIYINAIGPNINAYFNKNEFFAQKRLVEQLFPVRIEEFDFTNSDEVMFLMVGFGFELHDDLSINVAESICQAFCTFLAQTKTVNELYYSVVIGEDSLNLFSFDRTNCLKFERKEANTFREESIENAF